MKKTLAASFVAILLAWCVGPSSRAFAHVAYPQGETPRFEDFPVAENFKGKPAAVRLTSPEARKYRTTIREGAREGANFAGHYTLVEWGCGAGCVQFAIVDAKTGAVFMPSFYVGPRALVEGAAGEPEEPLHFRIESKLLIVSGSRNEKGEGVYYYKWEGNRLRLIATAAAKKPQAAQEIKVRSTPSGGSLYLVTTKVIDTNFRLKAVLPTLHRERHSDGNIQKHVWLMGLRLCDGSMVF